MADDISSTKKRKREKHRKAAPELENTDRASKKRKHGDGIATPHDEGEQRHPGSSEPPKTPVDAQTSTESSENPQAAGEPAASTERVHLSKKEQKRARKALKDGSEPTDADAVAVAQALSHASTLASLPAGKPLGDMQNVLPNRYDTETQGETHTEQIPAEFAPVDLQSTRRFVEENHGQLAAPLAATDFMEPSQDSVYTDPQSTDDQDRLSKMQSTIKKYMKKSALSEPQFLTALRTIPIRESRFYAFAKKYFARSSVDEFELLVEAAVKSFAQSQNTSATQTNHDLKTAPRPIRQNMPNGISGATSAVASRAEIAYEQYAASGQLYVTGPFSSQEENVLKQAVQEYCDLNNLSRTDFCNLVHKEGNQSDKKKLYAEFIYLLPNRKSRSVKDHLRRAYIPYERGAYTQEDDRRILALRAEKGADWVAIAGEMGRYAHDVRDRYRNYLVTARRTTGEWTPEETMKFEEILNTFQDKNQVNWGTIAERMETRTRVQCRDRFLNLQGEKSKASNPKRRRFEALVPTKFPTPTTTTTSTTQQEPGPETESEAQAMGQGTAAAAAGGGSHARILGGDVLHMLSQLQASGHPSISDAVSRGLFIAYTNIFTGASIKRRLESALHVSADAPLDAQLLESAIERTRRTGQVGDGEGGYGYGYGYGYSRDRLATTLVHESDGEGD